MRRYLKKEYTIRIMAITKGELEALIPYSNIASVEERWIYGNLSYLYLALRCSPCEFNKGKGGDQKS